MNNSVFGWNYPAGAEFDPNAPWNQPDTPPCQCDECDDVSNDDFDGAECGMCDTGTYREVVPAEPDWDSMPGGADWDD